MGKGLVGSGAAVLVVLHARRRSSTISLVGIRQTLNPVPILTDVYHRRSL